MFLDLFWHELTEILPYSQYQFFYYYSGKNNWQNILVYMSRRKPTGFSKQLSCFQSGLKVCPIWSYVLFILFYKHKKAVIKKTNNFSWSQKLLTFAFLHYRESLLTLQTLEYTVRFTNTDLLSSQNTFILYYQHIQINQETVEKEGKREREVDVEGM